MSDGRARLPPGRLWRGDVPWRAEAVRACDAASAGPAANGETARGGGRDGRRGPALPPRGRPGFTRDEACQAFEASSRRGGRSRRARRRRPGSARRGMTGHRPARAAGPVASRRLLVGLRRGTPCSGGAGVRSGRTSSGGRPPAGGGRRIAPQPFGGVPAGWRDAARWGEGAGSAPAAAQAWREVEVDHRPGVGLARGGCRGPAVSAVGGGGRPRADNFLRFRRVPDANFRCLIVSSRVR
jgi:hypothetical protein